MKYMIVQVTRWAGGTTNDPIYEPCFWIIAKDYKTPEEALEFKNKLTPNPKIEYVILSYYG